MIFLPIGHNGNMTAAALQSKPTRQHKTAMNGKASLLTTHAAPKPSSFFRSARSALGPLRALNVV